MTLGGVVRGSLRTTDEHGCAKTGFTSATPDALEHLTTLNILSTNKPLVHASGFLVGFFRSIW